jgi:hypothetical protein
MPTFKAYVKFHVEAADANEAAEKLDMLNDEIVDIWVDEDPEDGDVWEVV